MTNPAVTVDVVGDIGVADPSVIAWVALRLDDTGQASVEAMLRADVTGAARDEHHRWLNRRMERLYAHGGPYAAAVRAGIPAPTGPAALLAVAAAGKDASNMSLRITAGLLESAARIAIAARHAGDEAACLADLAAARTRYEVACYRLADTDTWAVQPDGSLRMWARLQAIDAPP